MSDCKAEIFHGWRVKCLCGRRHYLDAREFYEVHEEVIFCPCGELIRVVDNAIKRTSEEKPRVKPIQ